MTFKKKELKNFIIMMAWIMGHFLSFFIITLISLLVFWFLKQSIVFCAITSWANYQENHYQVFSFLKTCKNALELSYILQTIKFEIPLEWVDEYYNSFNLNLKYAEFFFDIIDLDYVIEYGDAFPKRDLDYVLQYGNRNLPPRWPGDMNMIRPHFYDDITFRMKSINKLTLLGDEIVMFIKNVLLDQEEISNMLEAIKAVKAHREINLNPPPVIDFSSSPK